MVEISRRGFLGGLAALVATNCAGFRVPEEHKAIDSDLSDDLKSLYVIYVKDRDYQAKAITAEELSKINTLDIDGYLISLLVFTKNDTQVLFNGQETDPIQIDKKNRLVLEHTTKYPNGSMSSTTSYLDSTNKIDSRFFNQEYIDELARDAIGPGITEKQFKIIRGFFYGIPFASGTVVDPTTDEEDNQLLMLTSNGHKKLNLKVKARKKFGEKGNLNLFYSGNNPKFVQQDGIKRKIDAIVDNISYISERFDVHTFNELDLIDFKHKNAWAYNSAIGFYSAFIEENDLPTLESTARHETMHHVVRDYGILSNKKLVNLFAEVGDIKEEDLPAFIMNIGDYNGIYQNGFFSFVNESNIFDTRGGHANAGPNEFYTSFLHSTLNIERVKRKISEHEKKDYVRETYQKVLYALAEETTGKLKDHLEECKREFDKK